LERDNSDWLFSLVKESVHANKSQTLAYTASKEVKTVKIAGCSDVTSSYLSVPWRKFQY